MNKILSYLLILFIVFQVYSCENNLDSPVSTNPNINANSKVLVELFSNVLCVACVQSANYCDDISFLRGVTINDTNVIIINIHTSLFPGDPFYDFNPQMNRARENYYQTQFNPIGFLMGSVLTLPFSPVQWTNQINSRLNKTNDISINLFNSLDSLSGEGNLLIELKQFSNRTFNDLALFVCVTERNLYFNSPNGKTNYNNILRQYITDYNGENIVLQPGQQISTMKNYSLDDRITISHSQLIVFVQCLSSKEVLGISKIKLN